MAAVKEVLIVLFVWGVMAARHLFVAANEGQIYITAEPGHDVTLPCRAGDDRNILVVEWTRPDLGSEYVFFHRGGRSETDHQHPSFQQRVDLQDRQMKDGDVSLILKKVTTEDTGIYKCRVFWREADEIRSTKSIISIIHLKVSPAGQKTITAEPGDDVTLPCRAGDGRNIIIVEWTRPDLGSEYVLFYRDGLLESDHQHPSFQDRVDLQDRQMKDGDVSLILKKVTTEDTGIYECRVFQRKTGERFADIKSIFIHLEVSPSGRTQDGGDEAGDSRHPGLIVGLSVVGIIVMLVLVSGSSRRRIQHSE